MDFTQLNWLAVVTATIAGFAAGGLWYGPMFGKEWMALNGVSAADARKANKARLFGITLVLTFIAATSLAMLIGKASWKDGLFYGFLTGLTFVATATGINYVFEAKPLKLWCINAGYQVVLFSVMGLVIGAWH